MLQHYGTLKNATTYTSSQKLLNKSAMHAVINFIVVTKQKNSGDISYLLSYSMLLHDVIMTSVGVYLFTVSINLVYVK